MYTRYSHPLNSTWHKQQSLCKKKGTIFVKRNIHALYHVSSPSRSPSLPPTPCFFFRETRGKGETPSLCCEISSRIRWMYYPPFVLIFFFVLLFFFFCRYISCACFRRFVRNYWNTRIQWELIIRSLLKMKIFFIFDWQLNLIFWFNYRNERLYNDFSKSILLSSSSTWMKVNYRASKNPLPFSKFHSLPFRIRHRPFHSLVISKKKPGLGETWKISSGESLAMLILLRNPRCLEGDDVSYSTLSWLKYPLQFFFFLFFKFLLVL